MAAIKFAPRNLPFTPFTSITLFPIQNQYTVYLPFTLPFTPFTPFTQQTAHESAESSGDLRHRKTSRYGETQIRHRPIHR